MSQCLGRSAEARADVWLSRRCQRQTLGSGAGAHGGVQVLVQKVWVERRGAGQRGEKGERAMKRHIMWSMLLALCIVPGLVGLAAAQPPRPGGTLRVAWEQDVTGFDPHWSAGLQNIYLAGSLCEGVCVRARLSDPFYDHVAGQAATVSPLTV